MSQFQQDYDRETKKAQVSGAYSVNTSTAGGRRAFDEALAKSQPAPGGSILDAYLVIAFAALIIFPVGVMALAATLIFFVLKRWGKVRGTMSWWVAFRRIYVASLLFSATAVAFLLATKPFRNPFPAGTGEAQLLHGAGIGVACVAGVLASSWLFRKFELSGGAGWAAAIGSAFAVMLPACILTAAGLLAIF